MNEEIQELAQEKKLEDLKNEDKKKMLDNLKLISLKLLVLFVLAYILFFKVFGFQKMNSNNMNPSIKEGSLVIIYKLDNKYKHQDVVSVTVDGKKSLYRVIGVAKDTIRINDEGVLFVNNHMEEVSSFYKSYKSSNSNITYPYVVPENHLFVVNDYRECTNDSREFGSIDIKNVNGKVIAELQIEDF